MPTQGLSELTSEQIEELCLLAEETARKHVCSRIPKKNIETLNITAEAEGTKPMSLAIDIDVSLKRSASESFDVQRIADDAVKEAFKTAENYLREHACHSQK
jgi:hypothetical protein